jgi:4'-phosphopantetheinyl transferase
MTFKPIFNYNLDIKNNELHIWKIKIPYHLFEEFDFNNMSLNSNLAIFKELKKYLSNDELNLCIRFYKKNDKIRSLVSKYIQKNLISKYLGMPANLIEFKFNNFLKPFIKNEVSSKKLNFNLSHAGDYIVIAFILNSLVGVDIELHNFSIDHESLINQIFSRQEILKWQKLSESEKKYSFYHVWSSKEALLKGVGIGLSFSPTEISVNINHKELPKILNVIDYKNQYNWQLWNLGKFYISDNYSAIYAINKDNTTIQYYEFQWNMV